MFKHEDKWNHFAGSYTAYILLYMLFGLFIRFDMVVIITALVVFFAGFLIEVIQETRGIDKFDTADLAADILGVVAAATTVFAFML
jgi:uncharacterized membrane protein